MQIERVTDADALHWAVFERGEPVAAARLTLHDSLDALCDAEVYKPHLPQTLDGPIAVLSRMVVGPSHAKRGLPGAFDRDRTDYARRLGCISVLADAHPSTVRIAQLQSQGFEVLGSSGPTTSKTFATARAARGGRDLAFVNWLVPEARPLFMPSAAG